jgi:aspartyl-tRNA synthetase
LNEVQYEFPVFNAAELVVGIAVPGAGNYTKEIDALIEWVKRPQVGASIGICKMKMEPINHL